MNRANCTIIHAPDGCGSNTRMSIIAEIVWLSVECVRPHLPTLTRTEYWGRVDRGEISAHCALGPLHMGGRTVRCAKSRLFLAQAEAHFPHSDPPPFAIRKCGKRQREVYEKDFFFRTAHLNFWDKEKPQSPVLHSFEWIMHASAGG